VDRTSHAAIYFNASSVAVASFLTPGASKNTVMVGKLFHLMVA